MSLAVRQGETEMPKQKLAPQAALTTAIVATRETLLKRLNDAIACLIEIHENIADPQAEVADGWMVKDVLAHITFWHESFARNISDLVNGRPPVPLKGKYVDLNRRSTQEMKGLTVEQIIERLYAAHESIQRDILSPTLKLIPYRKGSRDYTPEEHLDVVTGHIREHLKALEKVRSLARKTSN